MSASQKDLTNVVSESMEDGTVKQIEIKNTQSANEPSEFLSIVIAFLGFWGVCSVVLLLAAMSS